MKYTISTHCGHKVSAAHNRRDDSSIKGREHIDSSKPHEVWKDEKITAAYDRIFGAAIKEYNDKQKRQDRQIKNYYRQVREAAQKHPVYEMIVTIGNKENQPPPEIGKEIMRQFVDDWQKNNPNLEMIGAYYHADEDGAPHCHIDYIPVARGFQRGLQVQVGYTKALEQQGFSRTGKKTETPQILWQRRENARLERLCRERGIEVEHTQRGQGLQHLSVEQYKEQQRLRNQQHQIEQQRQQQRQQQAELQKKQQRLQQEREKTEREAQPPHLQALYDFLIRHGVNANNWRQLQAFGNEYNELYKQQLAKYRLDPEQQREQKRQRQQKKPLFQQIAAADRQQQQQQQNQKRPKTDRER